MNNKVKAAICTVLVLCGIVLSFYLLFLYPIQVMFCVAVLWFSFLALMIKDSAVYTFKELKNYFEKQK